MGKCICCGKSGFFVKINKDGLCSQCAKDKKVVIDDLSEVAVLLADSIKNNNENSAKKVEKSIQAQQRINQRTMDNFLKIREPFQKARDLEKEKKIDEALDIYLSLIKHKPGGADYYTRPCIILEKKKRYQEAIDICDIAINEIEQKHFNADAEEFHHRKERLMKKNEAN